MCAQTPPAVYQLLREDWSIPLTVKPDPSVRTLAVSSSTFTAAEVRGNDPILRDLLTVWGSTGSQWAEGPALLLCFLPGALAPR